MKEVKAAWCESESMQPVFPRPDQAARENGAPHRVDYEGCWCLQDSNGACPTPERTTSQEPKEGSRSSSGGASRCIIMRTVTIERLEDSACRPKV